MVGVPESEFNMADLEAWFVMSKELKTLKAKESLLRSKIFKHLFPIPKEGTNKFDIGGGFELKAVHAINRDIDEGALASNKERFREAGLSPDKLVAYKPSLVLREYRTLTEEQQQMFDEALIIKPGSTALTIEQTAAAKKAAKAAAEQGA